MSLAIAHAGQYNSATLETRRVDLCISASLTSREKKTRHELQQDSRWQRPYPVMPGSVIRSRVIGVLNMTDESGVDAKLLAVPHTKLTKLYDHVQEIADLPELLIKQIKHYFENYKTLEAGKWVKVEGWDNAEAARREITASRDRYLQEEG